MTKDPNEFNHKANLTISVIDHLLAALDQDDDVIEDLIDNLPDDDLDVLIEDSGVQMDGMNSVLDDLVSEASTKGGQFEVRRNKEFRVIEGQAGSTSDGDSTTCEARKHSVPPGGYHAFEGKENFIRELAYRQSKLEPKGLGAVICVLLEEISESRYLGEENAELLSSQAKSRLDELIRSHDALTRVNNNTFLITQSDLKELPQARLLAQRIVKIFSQPFFVEKYKYEDQEISINVNIGIASFSYESSNSSEKICGNAELAAYEARHTHSSIVSFKSKMRLQANNNIILRSQLREAVDKDQFFLEYQPKIDLMKWDVDNNCAKLPIVGMEALIRWSHPIRNKVIYPKDFIGLIENKGLMHAVTTWVLQQVFRDMVRMKDKYDAVIPVSVNFSPNHLASDDVCSLIANMLSEHKLSTSSIDIEITEEEFMNVDEKTVGVLEEMKNMGFSLSIDDFGKGNTSLTKFVKFPVSRIKLDKSFITDLPLDGKSFSVVQSIINLSRDLGLTVTAEGVENVEQAKMLRNMTCDEAQGFYFSKPIKFEQICSRFDRGLLEIGCFSQKFDNVYLLKG